MPLDKAFLETLLATNKRSGVTWQAGETSMLHLSPAERKARLGYVPGPGEPSLKQREKAAAEAFLAQRHTPAAATAAAATWDWRNVANRCFISSIKDQGNCGSCVAFGTAAAIDGVARVTKNVAVNDPQGYMLLDVSEAQLFYCGAETQGRTCATGWWPNAALAYATAPGVVPEGCFPYTAGDQPCHLAFGWQGQLTQVSASQQLNTAAAMKQFLSTKGPLIACFSVYSDFYGYVNGVYHYNGSAPYEGGHCICVIGYDDNQQAWLCKNSWGPGWGMGGYFYIGYGQCGIDSTMWAINAFSKINCGPATLFASGNMGQGSGAVQWLIGDVNGDGRAEIIQLWNNSGRLGMIVYGWSGGALTTLFANGNMGQGVGAVNWCIGDVNGDGRAEIIQLWNNSGRLGMIVYGWSGTAMTTLFANGNMGQGSGAVSWLVGDVNHDGRAEIIQLWNNSGRLGMILYGWSGNAMTTLWSNGNMGQGAGAVSWLIGDVNGDGRAEIVQQWSNGGTLGTIIYGWSGSAMTTLFASGNMGQGAGAVGWLIGDVNGDGSAEIIQLWNNSGSLGMIIYRWSSGAMTTLWSNGNMGQGAGALSWLIGDIDGDGRAEISQQWGNGGRLGMIIYGWDPANATMTTQWATGDMGQGSGAVSWLIGNVIGNGRAEIVQEWSNGGTLGTIVYGY